jgi:protein-tyrosine phosphatase
MFICAGNICRSAFAEGYMKKIPLKNASLQIASAGSNTSNGRRPPEDAVRAAKEFNVDLSAHRATKLTTELIRQADVLLVMEQMHREAILSLAPESTRKIFFLTHFSENPSKEILDPYDCGLDVYRDCFRLINACVDSLCLTLNKS